MVMDFRCWRGFCFLRISGTCSIGAAGTELDRRSLGRCLIARFGVQVSWSHRILMHFICKIMSSRGTMSRERWRGACWRVQWVIRPPSLGDLISSVCNEIHIPNYDSDWVQSQVSRNSGCCYEAYIFICTRSSCPPMTYPWKSPVKTRTSDIEASKREKYEKKHTNTTISKHHFVLIVSMVVHGNAVG